MKRVLILTALALLTSAPVFSSPAIEAEIKARTDEFAAAWNKHDTKAMADMWSADGDLINPYGRVAKGRGEVEKLFRDEHSTVMKKSTYKSSNPSIRALEPELALADFDVEISGIMAPDGSTAPVQKTHVSSVMKKASGKWWIVSARAFNFAAPPPAPMKKK